MMLRRSTKAISYILLFEYLTLLPFSDASPNEVIGKIVGSSGAFLDEIKIPSEGTILTGDRLKTERGGGALVRLSATTQVSLSEETAVLFYKNADKVSVKVSSGTLLVETLGKNPAVVETEQYVTEPAEQGKAIYLVAVLPDKSAVITARRGKVSIREASTGRSYLVPEGYMAVPAGTPGQEQEEPKQAPGAPAGPSTEKPPKVPKKNSTLIVILAAGAAAGIGIGIAASGGGGPASPSQP
jgi:FecR protein